MFRSEMNTYLGDVKNLSFVLAISAIAILNSCAPITISTANLDISCIGASGTNSSSPSGAKIQQIQRYSPAEIATLRVNDVIIQFGNYSVQNGDDLVNSIRSYRPGDKVIVKHFRDRFLIDSTYSSPLTVGAMRSGSCVAK
jgi:S1-C subfamily serine protease